MKQLKRTFEKTLYILEKPQKVLCALVFLLTCLGSALECLGVSAIIPLVYVIQEPSEILDSEFVKNSPILHGITYIQLVFAIGIGIVLLYVVKNVFFIFLSWVQVKFSCKIQREISVKMLSSYLSRGYQFFLNTNYGQYVRGILGDTGAIYVVISSAFNFFSAALTMIFICIFMFYTDWIMASSVLVLAIICVLLIFFFFRKKMYETGIESRKYSMRSDQAIAQSYYGVKDVLLLRKQKHFIYEYESNRIEMQKLQCRQTVATSSPAYIIEGICISGLMLTVCFRIAVAGADTHFIAALAAFAVGAFRILPSLGKISASLNSLTSALPSVEALYEQVLQVEAYAKEHPEAIFGIEVQKSKRGLISKGGIYGEESIRAYDVKKEKFHKALELKGITFCYDEKLGNVLENIDLTINKGQAIAFIGASGAGKSTLADVLLGLLTPQKGAVYMDGIKITDIPETWAETIGYVPQSVFLSDESIKLNVAFGESEEAVDEERVREALERAELLEFINSLPEGIETKTGDRGVRLSGGQRQRIAIARALYHRPEIMVLDEATSALDNETEEAIMSAIDSLQGQVTLIIVAHRLTTVKNCDVIYEVNNTSLVVRDKEEVLGKV